MPGIFLLTNGMVLVTNSGSGPPGEKATTYFINNYLIYQSLLPLYFVQNGNNDRTNEKKNDSARYQLAFFQRTGFTGSSRSYGSPAGKNTLPGHLFQ
jgi:hypothetical protein